MRRALRWILLVIVLGGAAYLIVDRMRDRPVASEPQKAAPPNGDQLTEEDRQGLNRLIQAKDKEAREGEASP